MVSHGYEQEEQRRRALGIRTLRWYQCHGCNAVYAFSLGVRNCAGCSNPTCNRPDIHIHSDLDGEKPIILGA